MSKQSEQLSKQRLLGWSDDAGLELGRRRIGECHVLSGAANPEGPTGFHSTKSGAGEQFLLKDCEATVRVKGMFLSHQCLCRVDFHRTSDLCAENREVERFYLFGRTANPKTKSLKFQGFDSVRFLDFRGGVPSSIGNAPGIWTHMFLVCGFLVCALAVGKALCYDRFTSGAPPASALGECILTLTSAIQRTPSWACRFRMRAQI